MPEKQDYSQSINSLRTKLAQAEVAALKDNIYHKKAFDRLAELENEISAIRTALGEAYQDIQLKDPIEILDASIKHWDKVLEGSEDLPEDQLIDYLQREFQLRIVLTSEVHLPTDSLEFQEGNGKKNLHERQDVNRVRMALDFLLHFKIGDEEISLDDLEITVGKTPRNSSRKRPYWIFKLPEYKIVIFLNNQYGNRTFVIKYESEEQAQAFPNYTKEDLKDLAKLDPRARHFTYSDPNQFREDLAYSINLLHKNISSTPYSTFAEACAAVRSLGIRLHTEYLARHREDPRLPYNPQEIYPQDFKSWGYFLRGKKTNAERAKELYASYEDAKAAVRLLEITSESDYLSKRSLDPKLPADPADKYGDQFLGWKDFTGVDNLIYNPRSKELYGTYGEASDAARRLGISSQPEYYKKRHLDPKLPGHPPEKYKDEFTSWPAFLGTHNISPKYRRSEMYSNYDDASKAARDLGINSSKDYRDKYKKDGKLPSNPKEIYGDQFVDWDTFLGKK
ncbi:hypothetical protein IT412_00030 [Candidatus Peregrinibacteria bacterium]|nr:hypothetical protein [Candidatus Peregrinibacteria bacterium]